MSCHLYHFFLSVTFLNIPQLFSQNFFFYHYCILLLLVMSFVPFLPQCHFFNHPLSLSMSFLYHSNITYILHTKHCCLYGCCVIAHSSRGWCDSGTGACRRYRLIVIIEIHLVWGSVELRRIYPMKSRN